ncbi:MAG: multidrug effflux MFS transporter [Bacteroidia bacterium]
MNKPNETLIILVLGAMVAVAPLSIDMYLPGFPAIAADLHTSMARVGLTLTSYFVGVSLGQLFYGPILDRLGRKGPLLFGLALFALAALGCAFAPDIETLIGLRFLLALGACAGMVAGRAVVRDVFPVSETARVFSLLMLVIGVAPILAPTLGGVMVDSLGWRSIFYFLAAFGSLMFASVYFFLPESQDPDTSVSLHPVRVLRKYGEVLREPGFLAYSLASGMLMGGMFAYISGSPFVFMELYGFSERTYGWIFGANALGLVIGSQLNRLWLRHASSETITGVSAGLMTLLAVALVLMQLAGLLVPGATLALVFLYLFGLGFANPNATALAIRPFQRSAGSASAMMGFLQMLCGALSSALISVLHDGSDLPMLGTLAIFALLSLACLYAVRRTARQRVAQV